MVFPIFNLPLLVQIKILKEYVGIGDKTFVLSRIPRFQSLLNEKSIWFKNSLRMSHFMRAVKPGWYLDKGADPYHYPNRFHISYDEERLLLTCRFYNFFRRQVVGKDKLYGVDSKVPFYELQEKFIQFFEKCVYQPEYSVVLYSREKPLSSYFAVDYNRKELYWSCFKDPHPLDNNTCEIFCKPCYDSLGSYLKFRVEADRSVTVMVDPSTCHHLSHPCRPNYTENYIPSQRKNEMGKLTLSFLEEDVSIHNEYYGWYFYPMEELLKLPFPRED